MFQPGTFFFVRAPVLTPTYLAELSRRTPRELLAWIRDQPVILEAITTASAPLARAIAGEVASDPASVARSAWKYLARMSTRATPFGTFSGFAVGDITPERDGGVRLAGPEQHRRLVGLDAGVVARLAETHRRSAADSPETCVVYRNGTLYRAADEMRYVKRTVDGDARSFTIEAARVDDALREVVILAARPQSLAQLAAALAARLGVETEEALGFARRLIDEAILDVADAEPRLVGPERLPPAWSAADAAALAAYEQAPLGRGAAARDAALAHVRRVLGDPELEASHALQTHLELRAERACLPSRTAAAIGEAAGFLCELVRSPDPLARWYDAFFARFEYAEVPLLEALDEDIGVGFAAHVDREAGREAGREARDDDQKPLRDLLRRRLFDAVRAGADEIELTRDDLRAVDRTPARRLPHSLAAMATILQPAPGCDLVAQLHYLRGPTPAVLLGRFTRDNPRLDALVQAMLRDEEAAWQPGAVFAEIAHLPEQGRLGNVLARARLRGHTIDVLAGLPPDDATLSLDDLVVVVSDERLRLRSHRLDREVIPRLGSAHNAASPRGIPVYRFLAMLPQHQSVTSAAFSWGDLLVEARRVPAVRFRRVLLCPRMWWVEPEDLAPLRAARPDDRGGAMAALRAHLALPGVVGLTESDNVLALDLDSPWAAECLIASGRMPLVLCELPRTAAGFVTSPLGAHTNEVVIPYFCSKPAPLRSLQRVGRYPERWRDGRVFGPESEWFFVKAYTGDKLMDRVLDRLVREVSAHAGRAWASTAWFFMRYKDPDRHLRFRVRSPDLRARVLQSLAGLERDGFVWKVQTDTYVRELERYGGLAGVEIAEQISWHDSDACLAVIRLLEDAAADDDARLRCARVLAWQLYADAALPGAELHRVLGTAAVSFFHDHIAEKRRQHGQAYRGQARQLERDLAGELPGLQPIAAGLGATVATRSERIRPLFAAAARQGLLSHAYLISCVHLCMNRVFMAQDRQKEAGVHEFLRKHLASTLARQTPHRPQEPA